MNWIKGKSLIILVCEGGAERAIAEILLDNNLLKFTWDMLVLDEISKYRKASDIGQNYLQVDYGNKSVDIVRIIDSRKENFTLPKVYDNRVINIYTRPEIEILYIISEGKYDDYSNKYKSHMKPSEYCKSVLGYKNVKKPSFIKDYFSDIGKLKSVLKDYDSKTKSSELNIYNLIK